MSLAQCKVNIPTHTNTVCVCLSGVICLAFSQFYICYICWYACACTRACVRVCMRVSGTVCARLYVCACVHVYGGMDVTLQVSSECFCSVYFLPC